MLEQLFSPFGNLHQRSCAIDRCQSHSCLHVPNVSVYFKFSQGATALLFSWLCTYHIVSAGLILIWATAVRMGTTRTVSTTLARTRSRPASTIRTATTKTDRSVPVSAVVVSCFVSAISHTDIPMRGRCDSRAGLSCFALIRARPHSCSFAQGLTMGSMWYDAGTNGSWAVSSHHSSAMYQSFQ